MAKIQIKTQGIQKVLSGLHYHDALAEYCWNGFDAGATHIKVEIETLNELGAIGAIKVTDNGFGIPSDQLRNKFRPFYESEKTKEKHHSLPHGNNGYGRFAFIKFAGQAVWHTIYESESNKLQYNITVNASNLEDYDPTDPTVSSANTGTTVEFTEISMETSADALAQSLETYVKREFGWFLVLDPTKSITVGSAIIDADCVLADKSIATDSSSFTVMHEPTGNEFEVVFVQWGHLPHPEYSSFYYLNSSSIELFKETTKLNNKGDKFYHSVYIRSGLFNDFDFGENKPEQTALEFGAGRESQAYEFLVEVVVKFLRDKRKPFLEDLSKKTSNEYAKEGAILGLEEGATPIQRLQAEYTKELIEELFKIEPRIFANLGNEQRVIFGRLLSSMIASGKARDDLMTVIGSLLEMEEGDRSRLVRLLDKVSLDGMTKLAQLVSDRYEVYENLKRICFDFEQTSKEKDIQRIVESELWIVDEQYQLITAEEPDFEEALRRILEFRETPAKSKPRIEHQDKNKEMDIFACRKRKNGHKFEHLVTELKRASKNLSKKDFDQLFSYQQLIFKEDRFNSPDSDWKFYVIGNDYATDGYIQGLKDNLKVTGDPDLIFTAGDNFRGYALTWSQVLERFELNHQYLRDELTAKSESLLKTINNENHLEKSDLQPEQAAVT